MAKLMVSMPEKMIKDINQWSAMESRSKSELLREALRFWYRNKKNTFFILEDIDTEKLKEKTEKLAKKITSESNGWNSTMAIRQMRTEK